MKSLRKRFDRFCFKHRSKGLPNLMLYITLGSAVVYFMTLLADNAVLFNVLRFDRTLILQGQVWRLITFPFVYGLTNTNIFLVLISLFCYYSLGRAIENAWGTFRFNLFYFSGIVLMDTFCLIFGGNALVLDYFYLNMGYYLNLSLFLAYSTLYPDTHFLLFFIIPVKAWIFALIDLGITIYDVINMAPLFPYNLFPLVAIANYLLFFGKDVLNLLPLSWRLKRRNASKNTDRKATTIPFPSAHQTAPKQEAYTHRCTICGRTDVSHPDLEFRYCSRCTGYHCYCLDHINNHDHVE